MRGHRKKVRWVELRTLRKNSEMQKSGNSFLRSTVLAGSLLVAGAMGCASAPTPRVAPKPPVNTEIVVPKQEEEKQPEIVFEYFVAVFRGRPLPCRTMITKQTHDLRRGDSIENFGNIEKIDDGGVVFEIERYKRELKLDYGETTKLGVEGHYIQVQAVKKAAQGRATINIEYGFTLCAVPCSPCREDDSI